MNQNTQTPTNTQNKIDDVTINKLYVIGADIIKTKKLYKTFLFGIAILTLYTLAWITFGVITKIQTGTIPNPLAAYILIILSILGTTIPHLTKMATELKNQKLEDAKLKLNKIYDTHLAHIDTPKTK